MTSLKDKVSALNELIKSGHTIHAMELFYSDEVEMQENEDPPRKGKMACIEAEKRNIQKINGVESMLVNQAIDHTNEVVFSEWRFLVSYKDNSRFMLREVSVQQWSAGQIIKETFYYGAGNRLDH